MIADGIVKLSNHVTLNTKQTYPNEEIILKCGFNSASRCIAGLEAGRLHWFEQHDSIMSLPYFVPVY